VKDFLVRSRIYNNRLVERREELGMSPRQIAEAIGVSYPLYLDYEAMRKSPVGKHGLKSSARAICDFHGLSADELFPAAIEELRARVLEHKFDGPLALPSPDDFMVEAELSKRVDDALKTLTPREERVVRMRFGLTEDGEELTFSEIGSEFWVLRERARQIEARALRKLRHPSRSRLLRPFVESQDAHHHSEGLRHVPSAVLDLLSAVFRHRTEYVCALVPLNARALTLHKKPVDPDDRHAAVVYRHDCPGNVDRGLRMAREAGLLSWSLEEET